MAIESLFLNSKIQKSYINSAAHCRNVILFLSDITFLMK